MHISQLVTLLVLGVVSSAVAIPLRSPRDAQGAQGRAQTPWTLADETDDLSSSNPEGDKVNVTLYVMSRCPDAVRALILRLLHDLNPLIIAETLRECVPRRTW
jgi:glutathionyl-hydroquinone reductase